MWRKRSSMLWLQAGDANTKFFHRKACSRRTSNCISALSTGSSSLSSHVDLAEHLFSFFSNQLAAPAAASHTINFRALYEDASALLSSLQQPFTMDEVKNAIFALAAEKAPGPDGFSLIFYQRFWNILKFDIFGVFECFYSGTAILSDLNSSWICPIPKKPVPATAKDLRPKSLLHSMSKIISKTLAFRLQGPLPLLINPHQTAFVKERQLLDNFFCAHFMVHHLHTTKTPAAVFKIDFERAFDNVNWDFLRGVLEARGFGVR